MSSYIKSIFKEKNFPKKINFLFKKGNFPEIKNSKNVILICTGTGISPIRNFLWERYKNLSKNSENGKILLFFGCRNIEKDFLYQEEFSIFEKEKNFK